MIMLYYIHIFTEKKAKELKKKKEQHQKELNKQSKDRSQRAADRRHYLETGKRVTKKR